MASPTPTGDPVTTTSPTPVSDPVTSDRPVKPIMGNVISLSKDDWSAWTGGNRSLAGSALIQVPATSSLPESTPTRPRWCFAERLQLPPHWLTNTLFPTSSLIDFQNAVWDHLTDCGMDSIAAEQLMLYDKYDKSNDRAAVKFVLSSLSPALMSKIQERQRTRFIPHRMVATHQNHQSTSIERFEDLKAAIKARHPSQYAGENLELLASDFRKDARELTTAGQYDHNLTLTMLKTFLLAGGSGNEDFRFQLRATKQKLDQALLDIGYKEKSAAQAHMVTES
ncbi:hypothetical protein MHU86_6173 [Fragilaria crotonensis]|nr:hypothetical protein MHU86_6173 [Fragilaria crotonensis]